MELKLCRLCHDRKVIIISGSNTAVCSSCGSRYLDNYGHLVLVGTDDTVNKIKEGDTTVWVEIIHGVEYIEGTNVPRKQKRDREITGLSISRRPKSTYFFS